MNILLAIGGNSLIRAGEQGTIAEQLANVRRTAVAVCNLVSQGHHLVLTHGNGPQVGADLLRCERAASQVPGHPLDVCDASTQGEIGYLLQQSVENELCARRLYTPVATVVTQCVVAADDSAMQHPSKPIGPFYSREVAEERQRTQGWHIVEDAGRGYRRVVPSPEPLEIVELEAIRGLIDNGALVIACGGGGIPVVRRNGRLEGVEAVIDKDRASALLACELAVDLFAISTDTDFVYLDYKKPSQRPLTRISAADIEAYLRAGHFPPGNMGPKIEAALCFLRHGGREVIITGYEHMDAAVAGADGTHIIADEPHDARERDKLVLAEVS